MSDRIPVGYAEIHTSFQLLNDTEPMFSQLGVQLDELTIPNQSDTNSMISVMQAAFDGCVTADYEVGGPNSFVVWGQNPDDVTYFDSGAGVIGTVSGEAVPNNTASLLRKITLAGGRRGRGRMFIPGVSEEHVGPTGALTSTLVTALTNAGNDIMGNLVALSSVDAVVLFHNSAPFEPTEITSLVPSAKAATQRRRMRP